jgi:hypothetical protein
MTNRNFLHLTGGLGNQLFQLAAGLNFSTDQDLFIAAKNGKPRLNQFGEPDLLSFNLPNSVKVLKEEKFSRFVSKVFGYVIRVGVNPRNFESSRFFKSIVKFLASVVASIHFKNFAKLMRVSGVGYVGKRQHANMFIGYFQTFKYAEDPYVFEQMRSLHLSDPGRMFEELVETISGSKTIIVHLRRGDYVNESSFGLIGSDYYLECINELVTSKLYDSIWVFSDDLDASREIFEGKFDIGCEFIGDVDNSSASVLELMRFGSAYVIGNSSFSWWGAYLRHDRTAPVYAPVPWFLGQVEPEQLIPGEWVRRNGHHFSHSPLQLASD